MNLSDDYNNAFYWKQDTELKDKCMNIFKRMCCHPSTEQRNERANVHIPLTDLNISVWRLDVHINDMYRERRQIHKLLVIVDQYVA